VPIHALTKRLVFPPPEDAEDGLLAVGGDLSPERLLLAYRSGIFPWYEEGLPILWHSPDPRCVIPVDRFVVNRTLRKVIKRGEYAVRFDTEFARVVRACKSVPRPGQHGTWITDEMEAAYVKLHKLGYAHSVEAWKGSDLAGGLYGVSLGRMFYGESMFAHAPNASKVALAALVERVRAWDFPIIDAQVATEHTLSMGAEEWPRERFLRMLAETLKYPTHQGSWADHSM
jgi:leucyl/phenylalanyl-tRNA--protein transferase